MTVAHESSRVWSCVWNQVNREPMSMHRFANRDDLLEFAPQKTLGYYLQLPWSRRLAIYCCATRCSRAH
jgi:hypothetical protein